MHHAGAGSLAQNVFILSNEFGFICNRKNQKQQKYPAADS